jgi:hypothetical protein
MDFQRSLTRLKNPREDTDSIQLLGIDYSRSDSESSEYPLIDPANKAPLRIRFVSADSAFCQWVRRELSIAPLRLSPFHLLAQAVVFLFLTEEYFAFLLRY